MRWEQSSPRAMILYSGSIRAIGRDSPVFFYHTRRVGTVEPIRIKENNRAKFRFVNPSYQNSFVLLYYNGENDIYILERNKMARKKTPPKKTRVAGEIKKLQRSEDLLIGKAPFCRLVKGKWLILSS